MPMDRVRSVFGTVGGTPWYSNLYFSNASGADQAAQVVAKVRAFWVNLSGTIASGTTVSVEGDVPVIDERDGKMTGVHSTAPASFTFTGTGTLLPRQTQGLLQLHTGGFINGKNVRGRVFLPAMLEEQNTGGFPNTATSSAIKAAGDALIAGAPVLVVWARPFEHPTDPTKSRDGSHHTVTATSSPVEWAVLRSRR